MITQAGRHIRVNTSLGEDAVFLESFEGDEYVSSLFSFELGLLTGKSSSDIFGLLTKPAVVSLQLADDSDRNFHGIINEVVEVESREDGLVLYRATMVPWLWLLSTFQDCRIFQAKTVPDIVKQVFNDRGFPDFVDRTQDTYPELEYCVQYMETDLNFVSRLLESEGVFYFFEHDADKHTLVLADKPSAFVACPGQSTAVYDTVAGAWHQEDVVLSARRTQQIRVGKITVNDFDFIKPNTSIDANLADAARKGEFYEYPAKYTVRDAGSRYARIQLEEQEVALNAIVCETNCRAFRAGFQFTLSGYYRDDANRVYSMLSVRHRAANNTHASADSTEAFEYRNWVNAIPHSTPYRPANTARRPFIKGSQTAVVVGKSGEEIWVDQYGRVKVQFRWDRAGKMDENSSCWVRVAQLWAGKGWGAIFTPRIGQEVIVDFLEGDPDRPVITGRLYNADQTVPYTLPDEQTKSTIKSMSSKGGGGFNEIRLEDKKDSEQIFIYGQKDEEIRILNDVKEWVGRDTSLIVTRDRMDKISRDAHSETARDHIEKVGRDHHLAIEGKEAIKVTGSQSSTVQGDVIEVYQGNQSTQVTQNVYLKGMNVVIEAMTGMTLKVGSNFITINAGGIAISGMPAVNINSGGAALSGNAGSAVSPLAPTAPAEADNAQAGQNSVPTANPGALATGSALNVSPLTSSIAPVQSAASNAPTHDPNSPDNQKKKSWIEIVLKHEDGTPVAGEPYKVTLPDGTTVADGTVDNKGLRGSTTSIRERAR